MAVGSLSPKTGLNVNGSSDCKDVLISLYTHPMAVFQFLIVLDIIWHLSFSGYFDMKYLYISMQDDFDVDKFVADCRKRVQLEEMREDLEQYYRLLKTAMVELINKDYADFVNLSTNLVSLCGFRASNSIFSRIGVPPMTVCLCFILEHRGFCYLLCRLIVCICVLGWNG